MHPSSRALRLSVTLVLVLAAGLTARAADRPAAPVEVTVYAAASLKDALQEVGALCDGAAGVRQVFNFGASNDLARQIVAAHKADIFFSADEAWMDHVARAGLLDASSHRALLSNRLVVVAPADSAVPIASARDLAGAAVRRLALANPEAVPAGRYAKAWLEKAGVWEAVRGKVVPAPDVRAALAAVEAGALEAGIVYRTDAAIARRAQIVYTVPEEEGPRIVYPLAALADRPRLVAARRTIECYAEARARAVFRRFGFLIIGEDEPEPVAGGKPGR